MLAAKELEETDSRPLAATGRGLWVMDDPPARRGGPDRDQARHHSFRATEAYLKNGGTLEKAAAMANYASTRTTQLYDPRRDEVRLDEVERISDLKCPIPRDKRGHDRAVRRPRGE
jgi:hypothetical protein